MKALDRHLQVYFPPSLASLKSCGRLSRFAHSSDSSYTFTISGSRLGASLRSGCLMFLRCGCKLENEAYGFLKNFVTFEREVCIYLMAHFPRRNTVSNNVDVSTHPFPKQLHSIQTNLWIYFSHSLIIYEPNHQQDARILITCMQCDT